MINIKTLIVYPPFHRLFGENKNWVPLGILYLSTFLKSHGYDAVAYNADCSQELEKVMTYKERYECAFNYQIKLAEENYIWDEVREVISKINPGIIGITVLTEALGSVKKVIEIAKAINPDVTIILGGPHALIDPEYLLRFASTDYVIVGEGEVPLLQLVKHLTKEKDSSTIEGVSYYKGNKYCLITDKRAIDINNIAIPNLYNCYNLSTSPAIKNKLMIETSRGGCIYSCSFCHASNYKNKITWRSVDSVFNEIKYYYEEYGTNKIFFIDEIFTCNTNLILNLCTKLVDNNIDIKWTCTTHVNHIDSNLLVAMKQAGCDSIHLGVETGSDRLLEFINKKAKKTRIIDAARMIKNAGIQLRAFFLVGFPTETEIDIRDSIYLMETIEPDEALLHIYVPVPGTPMYSYILENYINLNDTICWEKFSRDCTPSESYVHMAHDSFRNLVNEFFDKVEAINSRTRKSI
jgi:radical SAM superfamily enzyme YgiQ (UPF0313 family)